MSKTFYVAASAARQSEARVIAAGLEERGARVKARWLAVANVNYGRAGEEQEFPSHAQYDMNDVIMADEVVCLSGDVYSKGGRHSEIGAAIALGKKVWLIGPREQVFHWHPLVVQVEKLDQIVVKDVAENFRWRKTMRDGFIEQQIHELRNRIKSAMMEHGPGKFVSSHEILGQITEEYHELIRAVHMDKGGMAKIVPELFDLAVVAVLGVVSMRMGDL
jgi:hypothetical protein